MLWGLDGILWLYLQGLWSGKIVFETVHSDLKMNIVTSRATTKINTKDITNKGWGGILQKYSVNPTTGRE